jgi:hypothetical protein
MAIIGQSVSQLIALLCLAWHGIAATEIPVAITRRSTEAANLKAAFMSAYLD